MSQRYDLCSPRKNKKTGKTYWHRVGTAFPSDKGGFSCVLDSLPLPDENGDVRFSAFPPKDGQAEQPQQQKYNAADLEGDQIPFD